MCVCQDTEQRQDTDPREKMSMASVRMGRVLASDESSTNLSGAM